MIHYLTIYYYVLGGLGKCIQGVDPLHLVAVCWPLYVLCQNAFLYIRSHKTFRALRFWHIDCWLCRAARQESTRMDVCLASLQHGKAADSGAQQHNGGCFGRRGMVVIFLRPTVFHWKKCFQHGCEAQIRRSAIVMALPD